MCEQRHTFEDSLCEKLAFGEKLSPVALSDKTPTSREGHLCSRYSTAPYSINILSQDSLSVAP